MGVCILELAKLSSSCVCVCVCVCVKGYFKKRSIVVGEAAADRLKAASKLVSQKAEPH